MMVPTPECGSDAQRREEGLLRDLDAANLLHPALASLLFLEQLALPRDVATVALGGHVLAVGAHGLAGDDPLPHRRLHRDLELLARDELFKLLGERPAAEVRLVAVDYDREGVHRLARDENLDLHQVRTL